MSLMLQINITLGDILIIKFCIIKNYVFILGTCINFQIKWNCSVQYYFTNVYRKTFILVEYCFLVSTY